MINDGGESTNGAGDTFDELMQRVVDEIGNDKTAQHFQLLDQLAENLRNAPEKKIMSRKFTWPSDVRIIARGMLQSRLGYEERYTAFNIVAAMCERFGRDWLMADEQFLHLTVSLACVEIRLALDAPLTELTDNSPRCAVVEPCCSILVATIRLLVEQVDLDQPTINSQKLYQMNDAILDLIKFLFQHLNEISQESNGVESLPNSIAFPLHNLIDAFMEEGSELIDENLMKNSLQNLSRLDKHCASTAKLFKKEIKAQKNLTTNKSALEKD